MSDTGIIWDEMDQKMDKTIVENEPIDVSDLTEHLLGSEGSESRKNKLTTKHIYTFITTNNEDEKCLNGDIVTLDDDRIVVSDFKWSQLKIFDKDYNFCFSVPCYPRSEIIHYSANEILLTAKDQTKVWFYAVEDSRICQLPRVLDMKQKIYGLGFGNDHFGFLLHGQIAYVSIMDQNVEEVGKITTVNGTGTPVWPSRHFVMHPTEKKVYFADHVYMKIVCTTYSGEELFNVSIVMGHATPSGISLFGTSIIVGLNNGFIMALNEESEGKYTIQSLLPIEKTNTIPRHLAIQHNRGCILVGSTTKDYRDVIKSFQIKWSE